jgi:MEMO1 family protein
MRTESSLVYAGIAPHPPIMIPDVGGQAISEVRGSIDAMTELTKRLIASGAESLVLISPHAPLDAQTFVAYDDPTLHCDFGNFRAPNAVVDAPVDEELLQMISRAAAEESLVVSSIENYEIDHGTAVPLYFLQHNGWQGRVVALGYSFLSNAEHLRFGECVRRAADVVGRPVALIASGDLSHRLSPDAPAGYNPVAHLFDQQVVDALRTNLPEKIIEIDPHLRRIAGECGYRSMLVALGASHDLPPDCEVLHYEAPFGVGYLVAQLSKGFTRTDVHHHAGFQEKPDNLLPKLARQTIETFILTGEKLRVEESVAKLLDTPAACFVCIKTLEGDLRGCIGTVEPIESTLVAELINNAIGAATRDPRFPPLAPDELSNVRYSVDVLFPPEPSCFEDLDPEVFGVIVEDDCGLRGLLLPAIEGVETAAQQVEIAARKAGIPAGRPLKISRFRVDRFREEL